MRATKLAEDAGGPAAALVARAFMPSARATARALGAPGLSVVQYPGMIPLESVDEVREKAGTIVVDGVLEALARDVASDDGTAAADPAPGDVVVRGSFAQVQEHFLAQG